MAAAGPSLKQNEHQYKNTKDRKDEFDLIVLYNVQWEFSKKPRTALVALPLLDFQRQVQGSDGKVHGLRVHTSNLRETVADYISDSPCGLGRSEKGECAADMF